MQKLTTKEILKRNKARTVPQNMGKMIIVLHDIRSMHNVGAVFRNADVFGIKKILLSGVTPTPPRPEITKTAIGAEEFVPWKHIDNFETECKQLNGNNYSIIGVEQTDNSVLLTDYESPTDQNICLVFGNEVTGLDEEVLPFMDRFVEIPQYGNKHSLNVSVAVGVTLYGFLSKC